MSGNRKCQHKYCTTRITADSKYCELHNENLAEYADQWSTTNKLICQLDEEERRQKFVEASKKVTEEQHDILKRLKDGPAMTLPTQSDARKQVPLYEGCLKYFPAALAGVAKTSFEGNQKHNPGEPMYHARGKSMDHGDCILRHLTDLADLLAAQERGTPKDGTQILAEASCLAWRALALSQELHEKFGAPLAPGARE